MPTKRLALALPLLLTGLVFAGAGCFSFGSSAPPAPTNSFGGVFQTTDGSVSWTNVSAVPTAAGVGNFSGENVTSLVADPQDPLTIYAGTYANGLFYTIDGGQSWQRPRTDIIRTGNIVAVAVDPKNVCTVYVTKAQHLYKTQDCFRHLAVDLFVETRSNVLITNMAVDWYNPSNVWLTESNGDVQVSNDGGSTWHRAFNAATPIAFLAFSQADSRVMLIGTNNAGFFRSGDGGVTWTHILTQLNNIHGAATVYSLTQDPKGTTMIAATQYGLIRSLDNGATWQPITLLTEAGQVKIDAVVVGPASTNTIAYVTSVGFYRSTDGGVTWNTHRLPSSRPPTHLLGNLQNPLTYLLSFGPAPASK